LGSAVEKILEEAREGQAGLIVMGTKASGNVAGHAPLTIGYNVVAKATCPVLTFRGQSSLQGAESPLHTATPSKQPVLHHPLWQHRLSCGVHC
jgi:hypothetical protein